MTKRFEFKLKVNFIDEETGEEIYHKVLIDNSNGNEIGFDDMGGLLNNQQDEIQQLKEKLQISEASLALLIDMILLGDVDELVKRARECARQFAEQFDKFTKEELEEMITGGVSDE